MCRRTDLNLVTIRRVRLYVCTYIRTSNCSAPDLYRRSQNLLVLETTNQVNPQDAVSARPATSFCSCSCCAVLCHSCLLLDTSLMHARLIRVLGRWETFLQWLHFFFDGLLVLSVAFPGNSSFQSSSSKTSGELQLVNSPFDSPQRARTLRSVTPTAEVAARALRMRTPTRQVAPNQAHPMWAQSQNFISLLLLLLLESTLRSGAKTDGAPS
ncbi:uncharacterized protein LY89DRAFT_11289 [Mollisia scopiformis]|uniref:Uncharacterized protein n=1 Tax=Mollisia scopiformis TaxID=149040 RepID=A0A194XVA6_MOLSC|nr:uncharacterized protein LY89DRAFT_11289 [Mollisia scopiformis]KUJ24071.1 hypothetical protein LY89DRAFT_11289 [Mollisia scopiformis]